MEGPGVCLICFYFGVTGFYFQGDPMAGKCLVYK